ncbi:YbaB/EbfC family nucleoid-associated protein [Streptomyces sp. NPDC051987]|uniref:YbaB/EbfC family nucleoid-associated protein n=1 Tax=Streptomyces sp. NPDC051987 TaxID=3155808 RepID=UPI0034355AED
MTPGTGSYEARAAMRARAEELLAEYGRMRAKLNDVRASTREVRGTARTADGGIKVTVNSRGGLLGLEIEPSTYRKCGPTELAERIMALSNEATADAARQMEGILGPFLPKHIPYQDVISGAADLTTLGDQPVSDETFDAWRANFGRPAQEEDD